MLTTIKTLSINKTLLPSNPIFHIQINLNIDNLSGMLDRSPCGSGTAAIVASMWHKGYFKIGMFVKFDISFIYIVT